MEKVIFFVVAFAMFIALLSKIVKRKDSMYVYLLFFNIIGIVIRFIEHTNNIELNTVTIAVTYLISIIIPVIIVLLEVKKIFLPEIFAVFRAKIYLKFGQNNKARRILIKFIEKHPGSYFSHKLLADIYEQEGKYEEAIDEFVLAVDINKKDYDSYYEIAFLLNQTEKIEESKKMLEELLEKKPEYYKASDLLGTILYSQELFRESVNVYLRAIEYNPDKYELYYGLGMAYTRLNDFQAAKEYYEKAAKLNSLLFHAKINIAQIMLLQGELEDAEEKFLECMEDKESEPDAYFYLAIIYLIKGDKDRAVSYANIAVELDKRMYKRISRQDIFAPVMNQIRENQNRNHKNTLTKQELKTKKHLEDMFALINKMTSNGKKIDKSDSKIKQIKNIAQREY